VVGAGGVIRTPGKERQADLLKSEGILVMDGKVVGIRNR
jgi:alkylated DNA nucleotide flippase Atl1